MRQENNLIYNDSFKSELTDIVYHIAFNLQNPPAAERLSTAIKGAIEKRFHSPVAFEAYVPSQPTKFTYYRIYVRKYTIFYYFNHDAMHISHIFYSASDFSQRLD